jgi:hypothetical protein
MENKTKIFRIKKVEKFNQPTIYVAEVKQTFFEAYIENINIFSFLFISITVIGTILFLNIFWFLMLNISLTVPLVKLKIWKKLIKSDSLEITKNAIQKEKNKETKIVTYIEEENL